ncbi:MAG: S-methyl-5-thioribose-1-phosphate isomerase [bacterium]|nr:S-methyl-5-thioribose-1-phosphate isomerase [bacterium]
MTSTPYIPLEYRDGRLRWIDQTKLPQELLYRESADWRDVVAAIQRLELRGAPLLGIAGAYAVVLLLNGLSKTKQIFNDLDDDELQQLTEIGRARPTAVNLMIAVQRLLDAIRQNPQEDFREVALHEAEKIADYERKACEKISHFGATHLRDCKTFLTHCNTGPLATGGMGTAFGVVMECYRRNILVQVFATDTQPLRQGARLTVWEFQQWGVPVTLIPDTAAAGLLRSGTIDAVVVGADRVTRNGDFANKVGTAGLAGIAHLTNTPFYSAFPWSTIDANLLYGSEISIEERSPQEVLGTLGYPIGQEPPVWNPAFDVTPHTWVSGYITDRGVFTRDTFTQQIAAPAAETE